MTSHRFNLNIKLIASVPLLWYNIHLSLDSSEENFLIKFTRPTMCTVC